MTQEPAGLCGGRPKYWLPAGRVDAGEGFIEAGKREALEEAGIECEITGVLKFMYYDCPRLVLMAKPLDDNAPCKTIPDFESVGAIWVTMKDLQDLNDPDDYRSPDPVEFFGGVERGELTP